MGRKNFFNNKWVSYTGVIGIIFMLLGGGYGAGIYKGEIDCTLDKTELIVDYQEKLTQAQSALKENQIQAVEEKSRDFSEIIEILKKHK